MVLWDSLTYSNVGTLKLAYTETAPGMLVAVRTKATAGISSIRDTSSSKDHHLLQGRHTVAQDQKLW